MSLIQFEGTTHEFPDDFSDEDISIALSQGATDGRNTPDIPTAMDDGIMQPELANKDDDKFAALAFPLKREEALPDEERVSRDVQTPVVFGSKGLFRTRSLSTIKDDVGSFRDNIQQIETGGLDQPFIRTKLKPSGSQRGSSAYGPFQITQGLLIDFMTNNRQLFDFNDEIAMNELITRQEIALSIGGRDRASYERGGRNHAIALQWSKDLEFDTVDLFLDAFDYGGDYGLADNTEFQLAYENFSRKMLKHTLKKAGNNALEAASVWHGGSGWKTAKSRKDTDKYRDKFESLQG